MTHFVDHAPHRRGVLQLDRLVQFDERKAKVIEMRFCGGLSAEETTAVLQISPPGVTRDWKLAKTGLERETK